MQRRTNNLFLSILFIVPGKISRFLRYRRIHAFKTFPEAANFCRIHAFNGFLETANLCRIHAFNAFPETANLRCLWRRHLVFLVFFVSIQGQSQIHPGLYEADGTPHPVHSPNSVTGSTLNVLDFGADPADNEIDDRPAIEAALNSATFGDELYFPAGSYNFLSTKPGDNSSHILPKSGVNWRGESIPSTILKSGFGDKTIERFFKMRAVHDIVFSKMTISSDFLGGYSTDTGTNNPEAGGPRYVLSIEEDNGQPCYNIVIDSVLVENYRTHGVRLSNSHDVLVRNSIFQKATDVGGGGAGYGVSIQGDKQQNNNSKFNVVETSRFLGPYMRHGILLQYATHHNAVRFNFCEDNRLDAIDLHGEDEYLNEIYENEVDNVRTGAGVGVGNTGSTHDRSGPHNFIHDNRFINCREGVKVYLGSPDTRIENNIITESTVSNGKGIYILNGPRTVIRGNQIFSNTGSGFTGIYLQYDGGTDGKGSGPPQDVRIIENTIYENPYGLRINAGERIIYEDNDVQNNTIADFYASSSVNFHKLLNLLVDGSGRIETDPPGDSFPEGANVTVTALPLANWRFDHWDGDAIGAENPISVQMDRSKTITALFSEKAGSDEVNLFVNTNGKGQIRLDPAGGVFPRGTVVYVEAIPDSSWKFVGWSGELSSTSVTDSILLDADKTVSANFEKAQVFAIVPWIVGSGQLVLNPPGGTYTEGSTVTLTAVPETGWEFSSWGGSLIGSQNPETLLIDAQKAVMVTFIQTAGILSEQRVFENALYPNYPNPFNDQTGITFSLARPGHVSLQIFDSRGRLVLILADKLYDRGRHTVTWSAESVTSGIYLLRIDGEEYSATSKMVLSR